MYNEVYGYHEANTEPVSGKIEIYGVELEIDDDSRRVRSLLDANIDKNIITAPVNEDETRGLKVIERDSSVYVELILCADETAGISSRMDYLNENGINPSNINNSAGTSNHIHINREYLYKKGISLTNFYKCTEFFSPLIYAVSGRTFEQWVNWSEPVLSTPLFGINWKNRGREASNIHSLPSGRYHLVNPTNDTVEIRGFSNAHNFNKSMVMFYLDIVKFLIRESEYMIGRYYSDCGEELRDHLKEWLKQYPHMVKKFQLWKLFTSSQQLETLSRVFNSQWRMQSKIKFIRRCIRHGESHQFIIKEYIDMIYNYNLDKNRFTPTRDGVKFQLEKIERTVPFKQAEYLAVYYSLKQYLEGGL